MTREKLTPWDAPYDPKKLQQIPPGTSLRDLLESYGSSAAAAGVNAANRARLRGIPTSESAEPDPKWYQLRKKYKGKSLWQTPLVYLWFLTLIGFNLFMMLSDSDLDGADVMSGGSIGFIAGIMLLTWLNRVTQASSERLEKIGRDLERMDMQFEMDRVQNEARIMVRQARADAEEYVRRALNPR